MRRATLLGTLTICLTALGFLLLSYSPVAAQNTPVPAYNPYPPGILPADLGSEIARVRREISLIFSEALDQWHALPPPTLTNTQGIANPPTLQGTGVAAVEILGKLMNFDENMSPFRNEACSFCHMPYA